MKKATWMLGMTAAALMAVGTLVTSEADAAPKKKAGSLEVEITGVRGTKGSILVAVYDDAGAYSRYDSSAAVASFQLRVKRGVTGFSLAGLPAGNYAIVALHDENLNGDLDFDGQYPSEGYGSSANDPFGEPSFKDASVKVGGGKAKSTVEITYLQK